MPGPLNFVQGQIYCGFKETAPVVAPTPEEFFQTAQALETNQDYSGALTIYLRILRQVPEMDPLRASVETQLVHLGYRFFVDQQYPLAFQALEQVTYGPTYVQDLLSISREMDRSASMYNVTEVTLRNGLMVRSFTRLDGGAARVHVFYNTAADAVGEGEQYNPMVTVFTGDVSLFWGRGRSDSFSLGSGDANLATYRSPGLRVTYAIFGNVTFEDIYSTLPANNALVETMRLTGDDVLPANLYVGLEGTTVSRHPLLRHHYSGWYEEYVRHITLTRDPDLSTIVHELMHHYDLYVTREGGPGDRSTLFRQISWQLNARGQRQSALRLDDDMADFRGGECAACETDSCQGGVRGTHLNLVHDPHPYGMENPLEDMATWGEDYYMDGEALRQYVRDAMAEGNFEPAAKYLFIKHHVFMGREFGLASEADAITFTEVAQARDALTDEQRQQIRPITNQVINSTEVMYPRTPIPTTPPPPPPLPPVCIVPPTERLPDAGLPEADLPPEEIEEEEMEEEGMEDAGPGSFSPPTDVPDGGVRDADRPCDPHHEYCEL